jgi:quercetin dioxygenase-like cupin family protein
MITFKIMQLDSDGTITVAELWSPAGGGVPLHTHPSSECFCVIEGEFEFSGLDSGAPYSIRALPGDLVFIPAGDPHGYRAIGDTAARTTIFFTPGTEMEEFFIEAGTPVLGGVMAGGEPDFPALLEVAAKHGLGFLPPPEA